MKVFANLVPPQHEQDILLLGLRVATAIHEENRKPFFGPKKNFRSQNGRVNRRYVAVRERAIRAEKLRHKEAS